MLYIVSTPIGNLDDLSLRQAKTLLSSEIILAEDTRSAMILLNGVKERFPQLPETNAQSKTKLISYYKEKEFEKLPEVISYLEDGKSVSLISESGTPLVSDPGYLLVKTCIRKKIPFTYIPGPSAAISAVVMSGFDPTQFMFLGFLPKKEGEKLKIFKKLQSIKVAFPDLSFVFYESAQRIDESLRLINESGWDPDVVVAREISKKFEEVVRGKSHELIGKRYKGEITMIIR